MSNSTRYLNASLDSESESESDDTVAPIDPVRAANVAFWTLLRERLMVNCDSIGVEHLDELAMTIIDDPSIDAQLEGVVLLLPAPSMQRPGTASPYGPSAAATRSNLRPH
ncbi:hypothetical protein BBJ28_00001823 [Nothophytophthora sp. Chile5]|nr:hypothetical protein BBJ28_00001823 [Nothophytophthora sp. Chile5]